MTLSDHWQNIRRNHRGPYRLHVARPIKSKPGFYRSEWLKGSVDADDVPDEALSLLTDPRDSIVSVTIWSEREQCFVMSFTAADCRVSLGVCARRFSPDTGRSLGGLNDES